LLCRRVLLLVFKHVPAVLRLLLLAWRPLVAPVATPAVLLRRLVLRQRRRVLLLMAMVGGCPRLPLVLWLLILLQLPASPRRLTLQGGPASLRQLFMLLRRPACPRLALWRRPGCLRHR
jgi:hypothetical protein